MPDLVVNTGPVIALTAACGSLDFLEKLYNELLIPFEVLSELEAGGADSPELAAINNCSVIRKLSKPTDLPLLLRSQLDLGESSVIQNAVLQAVPAVVIDEKLGRQIARLHGLRVTGSIGILVKASKSRFIPDLSDCFNRMQDKGVWIGEALKAQALKAIKSN